ncbi:MAG: site-specific integrase [Actinomycetes bacterium]|jgi:integrase|nr:site-specific integrase [Actinomycetes bacterium]
MPQTELEEILRLVKDLHNGFFKQVSPLVSTMTFAEYADAFHHQRTICATVSEATLQKDASLISVLKRYFGNTTFDCLDPRKVRSAFKDLQLDKPNYSKTFLNMLHTKLHHILQQAVSDNLLLANPCNQVQSPRPDTQSRNCLDLEEVRRLHHILREHPNMDSRIVAVQLALATGMRKGEILGLQWKHIDFENCRIFVLQSLGKKKTVLPPKTKSGKRALAIGAAACHQLERWQQSQQAFFEKKGLRHDDNTPVITDRNGTFRDYANFDTWLRSFFSKWDFSHISMHGLRHTHATLLLAAGVDYKTIQARLGHTDAALTLNLYTHSIVERDEISAQTMDQLLGN